MSRILFKQDNISILGETIRTKGIKGAQYNESCALKLTFNILVNGKLKLWSTNYKIDLESPMEYTLLDYSAWNDIKDFLISLGYDLEGINIDNWLLEFDI